MTRLKLCAAALLCLMAYAAHAGDIYVCKGKNGVKSYQNTPCAKVAEQVSHSNYDASMARAPAAPLDSEVQQPVQQRVMYANRTQSSSSMTPQTATHVPTGYQCVAGRKTWVQKTPCPATYTKAETVDVDGYTASGEHVDGTGTVNREVPVRQQSMDRSSYCDQIRAGARVPGGHSDTNQSYERNKILRNDCGG